MSHVQDVVRMKGITVAVIASSLLDFGMNTVFIPAISTDLFVAVVFCMLQIVTLLLQFFSWFFMLSSMKSVKFGGYTKLFRNFWHLFATTSAYVLFYILDKAVLFGSMKDGTSIFYDYWDNWGVIIMWSLERIIAVIHYAYSIYYVIKIFSNMQYFLEY